MGLATASKEGLGLGLLFTSCPLCLAAGALILKELRLEKKNTWFSPLHQFSSLP